MWQPANQRNKSLPASLDFKPEKETVGNSIQEEPDTVSERQQHLNTTNNPSTTNSAVENSISTHEEAVPVSQLPIEPNEVTPSSSIAADHVFPNAPSYVVHDDWSATLNQTNISKGKNNNKYYILQMLTSRARRGNAFWVWTRWGRVGEMDRRNTRKWGPFRKVESAAKVYEAKFCEKTGNLWETRDVFQKVAGKYDLLVMVNSEQDEEPDKSTNDLESIVISYPNGPGSSLNRKADQFLPSKLPKKTQEFVHMLFQKDMYTKALRQFDIDVRKMPLGKLSSSQLTRGTGILEQVESLFDRSVHPHRAQLDRLSSLFYSAIPHDFGRRRPPSITSKEHLQKCFDMCNVLRDIRKAAELMSRVEERSEHDGGKSENDDRREENLEKKENLLENPVDEQYELLKAELHVVPDDSNEYDTVRVAFEDTKGTFSNSKLLSLWRVGREGDDERFSSFTSLSNHRLLWHGSHIGSVAAILSDGMRIMPHSGGRVGRGIYFASECEKSQFYAQPAAPSNVVCMFLVQVALGTTLDIRENRPWLREAPPGFDSVRACGRRSPPGERIISLDGVSVNVPVCNPVAQEAHETSCFMHDEFVSYSEGQCRVRYVLTVRKG